MGEKYGMALDPETVELIQAYRQATEHQRTYFEQMGGR